VPSYEAAANDSLLLGKARRQSNGSGHRLGSGLEERRGILVDLGAEEALKKAKMPGGVPRQEYAVSGIGLKTTLEPLNTVTENHGAVAENEVKILLSGGIYNFAAGAALEYHLSTSGKRTPR